MAAIVTGASRGIGRAVAHELARRGAKVAVVYRANEAAAREVVADITDIGGQGQAIALQADITDEAQVRGMVRDTVAAFGRIDILVCSAGVVRDGLTAGMPLGDWQHVLATNVTGTFLCIREVLPHMMSARSGSIVNLSSVHANSGGKGQSNYAASKSAVEALTRSLAIELAHRSIRVNAVAPGMIVTDMTTPIRSRAGDQLLKRIPMGRFGQPDEVARAVAFLASPEAAYITGAILPVSGGLGC